MKAPAKLHLGVAKFIQNRLCILGKLLWGIRAAIRHCCAHLVPYTFIRVQFGA